jgi:hypothetical protein
MAMSALSLLASPPTGLKPVGQAQSPYEFTV